MAEEAFTYTNELAKTGAAAQETGFFTEWFVNMFAGAIDIQLHSPILTLVYAAVIFALVILRLYTENPIKSLGCLAIYIYTTIQAFSLYRASAFVTDFRPPGWQVTAKSLIFAAMFVGIGVWGVSRVTQSFITALVTMGLGRLLAPLNPMRLLGKLGKSDKELDAMEEGSAKNPKRQMTAIMFTDIVGYSKQMGADEAAMVKKLSIHNEIMRNQIVRNRGTVIKTIGDAFMVRFRSAENAVQCALDCQKGIGDYNKGKPANDQFHIRIGVHMGEVIHTGTDVFGEGVNIAARIEPQCDPDGVTVSDVVANAARNKVPAHFMSIGVRPMKNIAKPPELFKVFAIEEQQSAKVAKPGAQAAPAAGAAPGGVFKI
ncbi:MAG: adenylate/guanylate cyclase domain-containing protein [Proteobacteria bacterium]|nr:adenylate/guanylate cyclase domain-containing protein [Pseudomonadota bacterium]